MTRGGGEGGRGGGLSAFIQIKNLFCGGIEIVAGIPLQIYTFMYCEFLNDLNDSCVPIFYVCEQWLFFNDPMTSDAPISLRIPE